MMDAEGISYKYPGNGGFRLNNVSLTAGRRFVCRACGAERRREDDPY